MDMKQFFFRDDMLKYVCFHWRPSSFLPESLLPFLANLAARRSRHPDQCPGAKAPTSHGRSDGQPAAKLRGSDKCAPRSRPPLCRVAFRPELEPRTGPCPSRYAMFSARRTGRVARCAAAHCSGIGSCSGAARSRVTTAAFLRAFDALVTVGGQD